MSRGRHSVGLGFFFLVLFFFFCQPQPPGCLSAPTLQPLLSEGARQRSQKPQPSPGPRQRALREVKALQEKPRNAARKEPLTSSVPDVTGQRPSACPRVSQQPKANFTNSSLPPAPGGGFAAFPFPNSHFCTGAAPGGRCPTPTAAAALTPPRRSTPKNPRLAGDRLQGPAEETGRDVLHFKGNCQVPIFNILLIFKPL